MSLSAANQGRIPELDGIRGLAIALVVTQHYAVNPIAPSASHLGDWLRHNITLGGTGVDLFFILSGFLIGGILMDKRNTDHYFKSFYIRRVCRIIPLYFTCLAGYALFQWLLKSASDQDWFQVAFGADNSMWTYATFTQLFFQVGQHGTALTMGTWLTPTWSLAVEEQFYLFLPLFIWLAPRAWVLPGCLAMIFTHFAAYAFLWLYHPVFYYSISMVLPYRCDALLLGVICAWLVRGKSSSQWLSANQNVLYALLIVLLIGPPFFAPIFDSGNWSIERDLIFYPWMAVLYACLLLLGVTGKNGLISRLMRFAPLRNLGILAYGIYLFHQPMNCLVHILLLRKTPRLDNLSDVAVTAISLAVTLIFAAVSWRFFEKPIITWGHSFLYSGERDKVTVPAGSTGPSALRD